ncbi:MAG: DUF6152 family protein [Gammaproteobacteria bacterium]|nr:DUF6152 family protein [Gammaproteobacteria bacterium]
MRLLPSAILVLAAAAQCGTPVFAHHSQAMFDTSQEILIEGTVNRFDWVNPHMYLIVDTVGPDGEPALVEGEGLATTQALVDGLNREALQPGTPVVMRANPNQGGWGKQVRILDVTTQDGEIHPFYTANNRARRLTPAQSLNGRWAPNRAAIGAGFGAMARFPLTPEARAAQAELVDDGLCLVEPVPFLAILDEMRSIEIGEDEVVIHFDNSGDHVVRKIIMDAEHPADVQPTHHGHSVGRWEGDTLVIDTIAYEPNTSGLGGSVPSSPGKHTVERLTLTEERTRLRYEITVEDPVYLTEPAILAQQWDHRPDLDFSPPSEVCDDEVAARYIPHVPE